MSRELSDLEGELQRLPKHPLLAPHIDRRGRITFTRLELHEIAGLLSDRAAALLLMAAADLNRTALRTGIEQPDAQLVAPPLRRAYVVQSQLPTMAELETLIQLALQRRGGTVGRSTNAATETLFKDRLAFEGLPIRMSGAWTSGILIDRRKPDGVYPDPATGLSPELYLEVKKVNRVRDDIQKRLYEIAEASLEVKYLYGKLRLSGLARRNLLTDDARNDSRAILRRSITASKPAVVALLICRTEELEIARRYRPGAEAFIDRLFFADEIDDCLAFLATIAPPLAPGR